MAAERVSTDRLMSLELDPVQRAPRHSCLGTDDKMRTHLTEYIHVSIHEKYTLVHKRCAKASDDRVVVSVRATESDSTM